MEGLTGPLSRCGLTCVIEDGDRSRNVHTEEPSAVVTKDAGLNGRITLAPLERSRAGPTRARLPYKKKLLWKDTMTGARAEGICLHQSLPFH